MHSHYWNVILGLLYLNLQGLEEATPTRNLEEIQEEEEEKRAAAAEKSSRTSISSLPSALGTDPPMRRVKILMLGDSGVGKSSLICRWTLDNFSPTLVSTVGVDFKAKKVVLDSEPLQVQVWDTAGQEQFHKITTSYYRGANGIMLVYDVSDRQSLENIEYWIKNIKKHATDSVHVALIGNKTDLRDENHSNCVTTEMGREVATKFGIPYFETSAKEAVNVEEAYQTVLRSIVAGDSFGGHKSSTATPRVSIVQKAEKHSSLFSGGLGLKKDKKSGTTVPPTGSGSSGSTGAPKTVFNTPTGGDESPSCQSAASSPSALGIGGKQKTPDGKDCTIS